MFSRLPHFTDVRVLEESATEHVQKTIVGDWHVANPDRLTQCAGVIRFPVVDTGPLSVHLCFMVLAHKSDLNGLTPGISRSLTP